MAVKPKILTMAEYVDKYGLHTAKKAFALKCKNDRIRFMAPQGDCKNVYLGYPVSPGFWSEWQGVSWRVSSLEHQAQNPILIAIDKILKWVRS